MQDKLHETQNLKTDFKFKYSKYLAVVADGFEKGYLNLEEKIELKQKIFEKNEKIAQVFEIFKDLKAICFRLSNLLHNQNDSKENLKETNSQEVEVNLNNISITTIEEFGNFTSDVNAAKSIIKVISTKKSSKFSKKIQRKDSKFNNNSDKNSIHNLSTSDDNEIFEKKYKLIKFFEEKPEEEFDKPKSFKRQSSVTINPVKNYNNDY